MSDLTRIDALIRERLAAADERRRRCQERVEQRQLELDRRHQQFEQLADRIVATVIQPHMQKLCEHFHNAELLPPERSGRYHCTCLFRHTDRFPATTKLTLSLSHDAELEKLIAAYDLEILPIFFQFEHHDELAFPLHAVDEQRLVEWTERKLLQFVDTYLQLEVADQYQKENLVTDPVCGSRITKPCAVAQEKYQGSTLFFCSRPCHARFLENPAKYVQVAQK